MILLQLRWPISQWHPRPSLQGRTDPTHHTSPAIFLSFRIPTPTSKLRWVVEPPGAVSDVNAVDEKLLVEVPFSSQATFPREKQPCYWTWWLSPGIPALEACGRRVAMSVRPAWATDWAAVALDCSLSVSWGCYDKVLQSRWLRAIKIQHFIGLGVRSSKLRCRQGHAPSKPAREAVHRALAKDVPAFLLCHSRLPVSTWCWFSTSTV